MLPSSGTGLPMSWSSWFCWRRITLNRTTSMWKLLTCECTLRKKDWGCGLSIHKAEKLNDIYASALTVILTCTWGILTWLWRSMEWIYPSTTCLTSILQVHKVVKLFPSDVFKLVWSKGLWSGCLFGQPKSRWDKEVRASLCLLPALVFMKSTLTGTHRR